MTAASPRAQGAPLALERFLPYRLALAASAVSRLVARRYEARFGLSIPEWRLIAVLGEGPGLAQSALSARTGMDKVAVSRAAGRLIQRGLIEPRRRASDQRARELNLTQEGRAIYEEVAPLALETEARLLAELGGFDRGAALALLRRVEEAALKLDADLAP